MPTVLTEGRYASDWLKNYDPATSLEEVVIASGSGVVETGTVLGPTGSTRTAASAAKVGGNTGNGTLTLDATTPVLVGAKAGVYSARLVTAATNGGTFRVEDPDGNVIGDVAVGGTFSDDIKFATADGSTDFAVGDGFDITVSAASSVGPKLKPVAVSDDTYRSARAIFAWGEGHATKVDATSADVTVVAVRRNATVVHQGLRYAADVDTAAERAVVHEALGALNPPILVREGA